MKKSDMPVISPCGGNKWLLIRDLRVVWFTNGFAPNEVLVRAGFKTDGASIPRFLWRVCGHPLEGKRLKAAIAHDWLYRAQVMTRKKADEAYLRILLDEGYNIIGAYTEYWALRAFGRSAWNANKKHKEEAKLQGVLVKSEG